MTMRAAGGKLLRVRSVPHLKADNAPEHPHTPHAPDGHVRDAAPSTIGVLIAHGEELIRAGLRALLEQQGDLQVTGEAADGEQAVGLAIRSRPHLVLMDMRLPG